MKKQFLEAGKIVNTHGIRGDIKVQSWCDSPDVLLDFDVLYFSPESPIKVKRSYVHKNCVIMHIENIDTFEDAQQLKNKILYIDRNDVRLPENLVFIQDIIGFKVFDTRLNEDIGILKDVKQGAGQDLYVIKRENGQEALIPACKPFLKDIDLDKNIITVETIEGLI